IRVVAAPPLPPPLPCAAPPIPTPPTRTDTPREGEEATAQPAAKAAGMATPTPTGGGGGSPPDSSDLVPPSYPEMILAAIAALAEENGSSQAAISRRIEAESRDDLPASHPALVAAHLSRMSAAGELVAVAGGKYALPPPPPPAPPAPESPVDDDMDDCAEEEEEEELAPEPLPQPPVKRGRGRPPKLLVES
ncbi:unnamed protein product, partial [Urochloa humidicola]